MERSEYVRMLRHEETYWWHVGRLEIIRRELGRHVQPGTGAKILNVGCGTGGTVAMLESIGEVENVEASEEAIAFMRERGFHRVHQADGVALPFPDDHFDAVGAFDVLEHIEDDREALAEWRRVLKPGGVLVLTVPAYPWLWSDHDVSLHHFRRYLRGGLKALAVNGGWRVERLSYAIVFSLPLVALYRLASKLTRHQDRAGETSYVPVPAPVNALFIRLLVLEARLHGRIRFPAGTSLLGVLVK